MRRYSTFPVDTAAHRDPLGFLVAPGMVAVVTDDGLRLRSKPGLEAAILATLRAERG